MPLPPLLFPAPLLLLIPRIPGQIKKKIVEKGSITEAELDGKIKEKMDKLSGLISEEGAAHIIANELGIKLFEVSGKLQVQNILAGMKNVDVTGKVVRKYFIKAL